MPSLISVLVPSYNYARFVTAAIDSVLAQTYPNVEVVVADDASTDETATLVAERYVGDPRVRFYQNPQNIGLAANFNRVLEHARGEFVLWLPADDWILPEHLARLYALFVREPRLDVAYSRTYLADASGRVFAMKGDPSLFAVDYIDARDELPPMLYAVSQIAIQGALFRRALFAELGPLDETIPIAFDWELAVRLALAGKRFAYLSEPSACVRSHGNNASGEEWRSSGRAADDLLRILEKFIDHPGMVRIRGYETRIVAFVDWLCDAACGESPDRRRRAAAVREVLLRRAEMYEPARVREHRVSIAMPMTMRPAALLTAIDAVAAQTYANWEILVVEQGVVPVRELLRAHPAWERIACVRLPQERPAGATRNVALEMARGEYVTFLDEDNVIAPDHLETLVATIAQTGADVAVATARLVIERADSLGVAFVPVVSVEGVFRTPADPPELGLFANALPLNAILHHRRFYQRAGRFNEDARILEDFDYLGRLQSTARLAFSGVTTLDVHVRIGFEAQALGAYAGRYLATLDALYASRATTPEVELLRKQHRAAVASVLERRAELAASASGTIEIMLALAGRSVFHNAIDG